MATEQLFTQALGLSAPWKVVSCDFDPAAGTLELLIDFERGSRFTDPDSGELCPVHDTVPRTWQHLSFFLSSDNYKSPQRQLKLPTRVRLKKGGFSSTAALPQPGWWRE